MDKDILIAATSAIIIGIIIGSVLAIGATIVNNKENKIACNFYEDLNFNTKFEKPDFITKNCYIEYNDKFYYYKELEERNILSYNFN